MAQLEEAERKEAEERALLHPYNRSTGRCVVAKVLAAGKDAVGRTLVVGGWVKTGRKQGGGAFAFLELNDGSTPTNLQLKVDAAVAEPLGGLGALTTTGTSVVAEGELKAAPEGAKQEVEVHVTKVLFSGPCDGAKYHIAKKKTSSACCAPSTRARRTSVNRRSGRRARRCGTRTWSGTRATRRAVSSCRRR